MIIQDDETLKLYVEESLEHMADIENDLLAIEDAGADIDEEDHKIWDFFRENRKIHYAAFKKIDDKIVIQLDSIVYKGVEAD